MGKPRLSDQTRDALRVRHYSIRTEATYIRWIKRFILFHNMRYPFEMRGMKLPATPDVPAGSRPAGGGNAAR